MRKAALGVSLAVAGFLGSGETAVAQQGPDACVSVYNEAHSDSSASLREQIAVFADAGVNIHVQVLEDGREYGIDGLDSEGYDDYGAEDTTRFREDLEAECNWVGNRLNIIFDESTGIYDVQDFGKTEEDIPSDIWDDAIADLEGDLSDATIPIQTGIARFLTVINPYEISAEAPLNPVLPTENTPSKSSGFPWEAIGLGLGGAVVLSGIGGRIYAGKLIKSIKDEVIAEINTSDQEISAAVLNDLSSVLRDLPKDDAPEMTERWNSAAILAGELNGVIDQLEAEYESESRLLGWPSISAIESAAANAKAQASNANQQTAALNEDLRILKEAQESINMVIPEFENEIGKLQSAYAHLTEAGWDVTDYLSKISALKALLQEVQQLRNQKYLIKPMEIVTSAVPEAEMLTQKIEDLPVRLQATRDRLTERIPVVTELEQRKAATATKLQMMAARYDGSCLFGLEQAEEDINSAYGTFKSQVEHLNSMIGETAGSAAQSVKMVEEAEQTIANTNLVEKHINLLSTEVGEREDHIEALKATLPARVEAVVTQAASASDFAILYDFDVEDQTKEAILELQSELSSFRLEKNGLNSAKPAYLEIDARVDALAERAAKLQARAKQDRQEMEELRGGLIQLSDSADRELDSLMNYISNTAVDESTRQRARSIQLLTVDTSESRDGLHDQTSMFAELRREIESVEAAARADVRREQERQRERKRAQEMARAQAAARRQRSSSSSRTSLSTGSSRPHRSSSGGGRKSGGRAGGGGRKSGGRVSRR